MKDVFISYTNTDRSWAEWIAWVLEENGYKVEISVWQPGDTVEQVWRRSADFDQGIALLSNHYLELINVAPEQTVLDDLYRLIDNRRLFPIRIEECKPTGWLASIQYLDLVNTSESEAEQAILDTLAENVSEEPQISGIEVPLHPIENVVNEIKTDAETLIKLHRRSHTVQFFLERLADDIDIEMILIPSGTFLMGSPDTELERLSREGPQHEVSVPSFFMGKYPVTQAQWRAISELPQVNRELNPEPSRFKGDKRPVEQVSWYDAIEFCARLSEFTGREYRLPSEAEWEYACRAGTTTPFHFGETITTGLANYRGTDDKTLKLSGSYGLGPKGEYRQETTPVDYFEGTNGYGLFDMHGNIYEWCQDYWHESYQGAPTDGSAWLTDEEGASRVIRGGSWNNYPRNCRSASRNIDSPDDRFNHLGFRVVCSAPRTLQ